MRSNTRIQAVIFDCDGTLVDSEPLHAKTLEAAITSYGLMPDCLDNFIAQFSGKSVKCVYDTLRDEHNLRLSYEEFLNTALERTRQVFQEHLTTTPHAAETLARLTLPCAVASNGIRETVLLSLEYTGLRHHFSGEDVILTACQVTQPKPMPDVYLAAAASLNIAPEHCLAIEDSATGVRAALAAGMTVLGYTGASVHANTAATLRAAGAHTIINDLRQILTYAAA